MKKAQYLADPEVNEFIEWFAAELAHPTVSHEYATAIVVEIEIKAKSSSNQRRFTLIRRILRRLRVPRANAAYTG